MHPMLQAGQLVLLLVCVATVAGLSANCGATVSPTSCTSSAGIAGWRFQPDVFPSTQEVSTVTIAWTHGTASVTSVNMTLGVTLSDIINNLAEPCSPDSDASASLPVLLPSPLPITGSVAVNVTAWSTARSLVVTLTAPDVDALEPDCAGMEFQFSMTTYDNQTPQCSAPSSYNVSPTSQVPCNTRTPFISTTAGVIVTLVLFIIGAGICGAFVIELWTTVFRMAKENREIAEDMQRRRASA